MADSSAPQDPSDLSLLAAQPPVWVDGNELTLYEESAPLIAAMVEEIRSAERRVWLESYIVAGDEAGRAVAAALADRAAAGLDVRLMYDAVGSFSTPNAYFDSLQAAGVQVYAYRTLSDGFRRLSLRWLNRRNHRKLLIVDDAVAFFGGMNVVDQRQLATVEAVKQAHLPQSAGWRDVHVRMRGPQCTEVAAAFEWLWLRSHHLPAGPRRRWPLAEMLSTKTDSLFFFDSYPHRRSRRIDRVFVPLIRRAQHDITLSMAYFLPVGRVLRELLRARRRGVRVRVIVPGESDVKLVEWATRHAYEFLLSRGMQIYERQHHMLHSKVMVVDGRWTIVGSSNLDPRSLRLNLEMVAAVRSRDFALAVKRICRFEVRHSRRIKLADARGRTFWERWRDRLAWSLRWWL